MAKKPTYEELEKRNKELEAYMDAMGDTLIVLNMQRKVIKLNKAAIQLLGYKEEEIPHLCFETIFPEKEHAKHYAEMKMALETGTVRPFETLLFTKDEEEVPVLISGTLLRDVRNEPIGFVGVCKDITDRKRVENALFESEERFRIMAATAKDAIIIMDNNGNISYWNSAAEQIFGHRIQEAIGKELHMLLAPGKYHYVYRKGFNEFRKTGEGGAVGKTLELEAVRKDGTEFPIELSMSAHRLKGQWHAVGIVRDTTERKRMEEELKRLSYLDGLTGVANRRRFDEVLGLEWRRMMRDAKPLSLIMCDIDFFKAYNDTYGHQSGDESLRQVANTLNSVLGRPGDLVARYGGEEYAVILPGIDSQGAKILAEKMRVRVESLGIIHVSSQVCEVLTISLGVAATIPTRGSLPDELISAADQALYEAKKEGRNRVNLAE